MRTPKSKSQEARLGSGRTTPPKSQGSSPATEILAQIGNAGLVRVRRSTASPPSDRRGAGLDESVARAIQQRRGGGRPLPGAVRGQMEDAFGHDFSRVRVHADSGSHQLNDQLRSCAFSVGNDIFFARGAHNSSSGAGRKLLAHELTHVVQQSGGSGQRPTRVSDPTELSERQAATVAEDMTRGGMGQGAIVRPEQQLEPVRGTAIQRDGSGGQAVQAGTQWTEEKTSTRSVMVFTEYTSHVRLRFSNHCDDMDISLVHEWLTGVTSAFPNSAETEAYFGGAPHPGLPPPGRRVEEDEFGARTVVLRKYLHVDHFIKVGVEIKGFGYAGRIRNGKTVFPLRVTASCGTADNPRSDSGVKVHERASESETTVD
jgi:hypothetical protein